MIEFDLLDKKILNILIGHGRMEYAEVARLTGTSTERVLYRINRLFKRGVINDFKVLLNYQALGYAQYNLFIKLKRISYDIREKWKEFFKSHPYTVWVGTCVGEYDYRVYIIAKDDAHLKSILEKIDTDLGENIGAMLILHRINKIESLNYLTFKKYSTDKEIEDIATTVSRIRTQPKNLAMEKLDQKDMGILKLICQRPKMRYTEMALTLGVTPEDIRYRMKKINATPVISRYSISVSYHEMGLLWLSLLVKITHKNKEAEFIRHVLNQPQTINIIENLGDWDMEITFCVKDIEEADYYLLALRERFAETIIDYQLLITKNGLKYPQMAEGIFEEPTRRPA